MDNPKVVIQYSNDVIDAYIQSNAKTLISVCLDNMTAKQKFFRKLFNSFIHEIKPKF